jgi:anti-sigma factor RsiW
MSKCQRFYEIISASVDSQANALEQLALQEHIKSCNACKSELAQQYELKDMMRSYQSAADIDVSSGVMRKLRYLKMENEATAPITPQTPRFSNKWVAMFMMFALTTAGLFLGNGASGEKMVHTSNPDPAKIYASYIYQHLHDEETQFVLDRRNSDFKHVSSIR